MLHIIDSMVESHCYVRSGSNGHDTAYAKVLQIQLNQVQLARSCVCQRLQQENAFSADASPPAG